MSQLITSTEEIIKIANLLDTLRSKGYNQQTLEEIVESLIPKNNHYQVLFEIGEYDIPACFLPNEQRIQICPEKLKIFLYDKLKNIKFVASQENLEYAKQEVFRYLSIYAILHEIGHVNQYLIANEYMEYPYKLVVQAYKNIVLFKSNEKEDPEILELKKTLFYHSKVRQREDFFLERNANIFALDTIAKVASYKEQVNLKDYFEILKRWNLALGYYGISNGAVQLSYRKLWINSLYNQLPLDEDIPVNERVLHGLPLGFKTRVKVLKKEFKI